MEQIITGFGQYHSAKMLNNLVTSVLGAALG
jgi:hypothetical protein